MTDQGVPADLLMPTDFVTLRMGLVDEVGFDAAVLLERIRWRCEVRPDGWVATLSELSEDTRLGLRRVKNAATLLRERGWVRSENAGEGTRTLRWQVIIQAPETPKGRNEPMGKRPKRTDQEAETALCSSNRENLEDSPAADATASPTLSLVASDPDALFPSGEVEKPATEPTGGDLFAAWVDGYRETHGGADPDPVARGPLSGAAKAVAKTRTDRDSWVTAWHAFKAAGRRGDTNVRRELLGTQYAGFPQRTNQHLAAATQAAEDGLLDDMLGGWDPVNHRPAIGGTA